MRKLVRIGAAAVAVSVLVAACGDDDGGAARSNDTSEVEPTDAPSGTDGGTDDSTGPSSSSTQSSATSDTTTTTTAPETSTTATTGGGTIGPIPDEIYNGYRREVIIGDSTAIASFDLVDYVIEPEAETRCPGYDPTVDSARFCYVDDAAGPTPVQIEVAPDAEITALTGNGAETEVLNVAEWAARPDPVDTPYEFRVSGGRIEYAVQQYLA